MAKVLSNHGSCSPDIWMLGTETSIIWCFAELSLLSFEASRLEISAESESDDLVTNLASTFKPMAFAAALDISPNFQPQHFPF
ncbi:hypothetical protein MFLAVUS_004778 [Mucor flavus]|uniref:Uncharacterized protein n=1 Tax=Mucor flavus TaxID=439312 RepID=A0ABP9YWV2_9FUNG